MAVALAILTCPLFAAPAPADAALKRVTVRQGPMALDPYEVRFTSRRTRAVQAPRLDGFIVRMHARVVDRRGRPMPVQRVMLHHVVYKTVGRVDSACGGREQSFYGTGEENATMRFPPGYGYRIRKRDRWTTGWMLMNHRPRGDRAYIEYTAVVDTSRRLQHVQPYWLRVTGCESARDPIFDVPGGAGPGSLHTKSITYPAPISGRLIAANSHVHGGSKPLVLSQPECGDRLLVVSRPLWGRRNHPYYRVRPLLHEPGPIGTGWVQTAQGIPVRQGEPLRLTSTHDNELPHTRVMGIMHVYIAPGEPPGQSCPPMPTDLQERRSGGPGRNKAPKVTVPLTALDARGRARTIRKPPGRLSTFGPGSIATVTAGEIAFDRRNLSIPLDGTVCWRFRDRIFHTVTLASGPEGFSTPMLRRGQAYERRFTKPGTYRLFCSFHPLDMTQVVKVRPGA